MIGRLAQISAGPYLAWILLDPNAEDLKLATAYVAAQPQATNGQRSPASAATPEPELDLTTTPPASGITQEAWDGMPLDARKAVASALPPW